MLGFVVILGIMVSGAAGMLLLAWLISLADNNKKDDFYLFQ